MKIDNKKKSGNNFNTKSSQKLPKSAKLAKIGILVNFWLLLGLKLLSDFENIFFANQLD